jgi:hypothetical protein
MSDIQKAISSAQSFWRISKVLKVIIRDDDLNFSSSPENIKNAYCDIYGEVPINFFIIPFLKDISLSMPPKDADFYWSRMLKKKSSGAIWKNQVLIKYLKEEFDNKNIGLGLHGVRHSYKELDRKDFDVEMLNNQLDKFCQEFDIQNKCISFPNNTISKKNMNKIEKYFDLFFVGYSHRLFERNASIKNFLHFAEASLSYFTKSKISYAAKGVRNISNHYEISSTPISYLTSKDDIEDILKFAKNNHEGTLCLATHFYDLDENASTREHLKRLVIELKSMGCVFLRINDLTLTKV